MSSHYPGAQMFMPMQPHMSVGPVGQNVPMAYYPMGAVYPAGSTVMVDGGYDAGARFTAGSSVSLPVSIHRILLGYCVILSYVWRTEYSKFVKLFSSLSLFVLISSPHLLDIPRMQLSWLPCRVPTL